MTNIEHILADLRAMGVTFRLKGTGFTYRADPPLPERHVEVIKICRAHILEQLRLEAGICMVCGTGKAAHPSYIGYAGRKGTPQGEIRKDAPQEYRDNHPLQWCRTCWGNGDWKKSFGDIFEKEEGK